MNDSTQCHSDECIIATIGDIAVTMGDAEILALQLQPPPERDKLARLAADITVIQAHKNKLTTEIDLVGGLEEYRAFITTATRRKSDPEHLKNLQHQIEEIRTDVGFEKGPCYRSINGDEN